MRYRHLPLIMLAAVACRADSNRQTVATADALPYLPIPPRAEFVRRTGSADAVQIVFRSTEGPTEVLDYYRRTLPKAGWSLEGDSEDAVGARALYLTKDGHPMWIRISQSPGMPWTIIEITGAVIVPNTLPPVADSAGQAAQPPGAS